MLCVSIGDILLYMIMVFLVIVATMKLRRFLMNVFMFLYKIISMV